jgi:hypothetical protein
MTAQEIRALYPNPISADTPLACRAEDDYCVGGALCKYLGRGTGWEGERFPMVAALTDVLQEANTRLPYLSAQKRAEKITRANDAGNIDKAWQLLDYALKAKR